MTAPVLSVAAAIAGVVWRRYRRPQDKATGSVGGYVAGTARSRIRARFSRVAAAQLGLRDYAAHQMESFPTHLTIPSIHQYRVEIDRSYVSLTLLSSDRTTIIDTSLLDRAIGSALIFGEPGSGKSSLTKKLFREECKRAMAGQREARLPVYVQLRDIEWGAFPSTRNEARRWLRGEIERKVTDSVGVHDPEFLLRTYKAGPGLSVILDGLDEVPAAQAEDIAIALGDVVTVLRRHSAGDTVVIVTARTQLEAILPNVVLDAFEYVYELSPFSPADVYAFLRRWPFDGDGLAQAHRIIDDLRRYPTLAEMCQNPLMLGMYVAYDQHYGSQGAAQRVRLPETRPDFYKLVLGELLLFRREEQTGTRVAGTQLRRTREELLGRLALAHLMDWTQPLNSIRWVDAVAAACVAFGHETYAEGEQALRRMAVDTGVFVEDRRGESLSFIHLSLCEFLAGLEVANSDDGTLAGVLSAAPVERRLWELAVFAVSLSGRARRATALRNLQDNGAPPAFILRVVRESQAFDDIVFRDAVYRAIKMLVDAPPRAWHDRWFSDLRLLVSCLGEAARVADVRKIPVPIPPDDVLAAIAGEDAWRFGRLLDMYLRVSPSEALSLAERFPQGHAFLDAPRIVAAMEQPALVELALDRVQRGADEAGFWALALGEAALRFELVASILVGEAPSSVLLEETRRAGTSFYWREHGPISGSVYRCVLIQGSAVIQSLWDGYVRGVPRMGVVCALARWGGKLRVGDGEEDDEFERALLNLRPVSPDRPTQELARTVAIVSEVGLPELLLPRSVVERVLQVNADEPDWLEHLSPAQMDRLRVLLLELPAAELTGTRASRALKLRPLIEGFIMVPYEPAIVPSEEQLPVADRVPDLIHYLNEHLVN